LWILQGHNGEDKFDHEELLLKSNNLQDKIVNGVKKWESLEVEFDALNTHWLQLKKGQKVVVVLNHYPMCYPCDVCDMKLDTITLSCCSFCGFNFPFKDIIIFNCGHLYHAWYANIWLKKNTRCKDNLCEGLVQPNWYKSFGFAEFDNHLEDKYVDMECELARCMIV
jgi:hypothetical protein